MGNGWIGFDLDGVLAEYHGWQGPTHIGKPVKRMAERLLELVGQGVKVKILTARVSSNNPTRIESALAIRKWCLENFGFEIETTAEKDYNLITLYDDRCIQVISNTGMTIAELLQAQVGEELMEKIVRGE